MHNTHTHVHTCTCAGTHACTVQTRTRLYALIHTYTYTRAHVCTRTHTHTSCHNMTKCYHPCYSLGNPLSARTHTTRGGERSPGGHSGKHLFSKSRFLPVALPFPVSWADPPTPRALPTVSFQPELETCDPTPLHREKGLLLVCLVEKQRRSKPVSPPRTPVCTTKPKGAPNRGILATEVRVMFGRRFGLRCLQTPQRTAAQRPIGSWPPQSTFLLPQQLQPRVREDALSTLPSRKRAGSLSCPSREPGGSPPLVHGSTGNMDLS